MGISHESILNEIESQYPEKISELEHIFSEHPELIPIISEDRLYELCDNDPESLELLEEMLEFFYRYTKDVCAQESLIKNGIEENLEQIHEMDKARTILHNAMIDSVRIFGRKVIQMKKDVTWYENLEKGGRAAYAKFALLTTFVDILEHHNNSKKQ